MPASGWSQPGSHGAERARAPGRDAPGPRLARRQLLCGLVAPRHCGHAPSTIAGLGRLEVAPEARQHEANVLAAARPRSAGGAGRQRLPRGRAGETAMGLGRRRGRARAGASQRGCAAAAGRCPPWPQAGRPGSRRAADRSLRGRCRAPVPSPPVPALARACCPRTPTAPRDRRALRPARRGRASPRPSPSTHRLVPGPRACPACSQAPPSACRPAGRPWHRRGGATRVAAAEPATSIAAAPALSCRRHSRRRCLAKSTHDMSSPAPAAALVHRIATSRHTVFERGSLQDATNAFPPGRKTAALPTKISL